LTRLKELADCVVDFGFEGVIEAFLTECVTGFGALQNGFVASNGYAQAGHTSYIFGNLSSKYFVFW
jgi:hypothetical protein